MKARELGRKLRCTFRTTSAIEGDCDLCESNSCCLRVVCNDCLDDLEKKGTKTPARIAALEQRAQDADEEYEVAGYLAAELAHRTGRPYTEWLDEARKAIRKSRKEAAEGGDR
jgi:hypothetical protein